MQHKTNKQKYIPKINIIMSAKLFNRIVILSTVFFVNCIFVLAESGNNLVYNTEETNGVVTSQLVYKMDNGQLSNFQKFNYTYDNESRMKSQEKQSWNSNRNTWENDLCINYSYKNGKKHIEYQKWNAKKKIYVLVPEMSVTVDDTETVE